MVKFLPSGGEAGLGIEGSSLPRRRGAFEPSCCLELLVCGLCKSHQPFVGSVMLELLYRQRPFLFPTPRESSSHKPHSANNPPTHTHPAVLSVACEQTSLKPLLAHCCHLVKAGDFFFFFFLALRSYNRFFLKNCMKGRLRCMP